MGFFVLLMLACWAMAIFGLFAPAKAMFWSSKPSRLKALGIYTLASFLVVVAGGITSDATKQQVTAPAEPGPAAKAQPAAPAPQAPAQPAASAPVAAKPSKTTAPSPPEPTGKPKADEPLYTAPELVAAYRSNEIAADDLFKGKRLLIGGYVREIAKDFMGDPLVRLDGHEYDLFGVTCGFSNSDKARLAKVRRGQLLYLRGRVAGLTLGMLHVMDCELVQVK